MIIYNMSNEDYHAHKAIGKSGLDLILRSPAHYKYKPYYKPSRDMLLGSATHAAILEPERFNSDYTILSGVNDRRLKEYKEAAKDKSEDFILLGNEFDSIAGMRESVRLNEEAVKYIATVPDIVEASVFISDPITGVEVKIRPDSVNQGAILDLKTTQDARPDQFARSVAKYNYHVQAAFYIDVWYWAFCEKLQFKFLAVEKTPPYANRIIMLDDLAIELGRRTYRKALNIYAECLKTNEWPTYPCNEAVIGLPEYMFNDDDEVVV